MPKPTPEHEWLQRFVGEWVSEGEAFMAPDQPPVKLAGIEKTRSLGFWVVGEITSTLEHFPYEQIYTIGYNPASGKYTGSVVDSMMSHMWLNEGSVEGNSITLETEGPCPVNGTTKFRETTEFKTPDHKVFTSRLLAPDGEWKVAMTINCYRKN
jgi:hypothetical protein